jgi:hypothetical protein
MSNRIEADEAKAKSNRHREATVTAPVLDSTRHFTSYRTERIVSGVTCAMA